MGTAAGILAQHSEIIDVYSHLAANGEPEIAVLGPDFSSSQRAALELPKIAVGSNAVSRWRDNTLMAARLTLIKPETNHYRVEQAAVQRGTATHRFALYRVKGTADAPALELVSPRRVGLSGRTIVSSDFMGTTSFTVSAGHFVFVNPIHAHDLNPPKKLNGYFTHRLVLTLPPLPATKTDLEIQQDVLFTLLSRMTNEMLKEVADILNYPKKKFGPKEFVRWIFNEKINETDGMIAVQTAVHQTMPRPRSLLQPFGIVPFNSAAL